MTAVPTGWASAFGEDRYGLWQAFELGGVQQLMRWIPPGEFMMGSPEHEPERESDEQLHSVRISRGFWLADTACTQALWQALMGNNPSRFSADSEHPVEKVSWHDVQRFIERASAQLPELRLRLPTEAEWEYACRAGSQSAFWWGDTLPPGRANYCGNYPYDNGERDEDRDTTVPVRCFAANPHGLYQMHGNVWEWCNDGSGDYPEQAVTDPQGSTDGQQRVCRGGSWYFSGSNLRAASRAHSTPDGRNFNLGFRLAGG